MSQSADPFDHPIPSDEEKQALWSAYRAGRAWRVPVTISTNARMVHAEAAWNPDGYTFEDCHHDGEAQLKIQLQHALYRRRVIGRHSDEPHELPAVWEVTLFHYNVAEAAAMGGRVYFPPGQVPTTEPPPFADDALRDEVFNVDIEHPLETAYWRERLAVWEQMRRLAEGMRFEGRPVRVTPCARMYTDGPVTVACNLRGTDFLMDLLAEPEYAQRLLARVVEAMARRRRAMAERFGVEALTSDRVQPADDACAMLSVEQWRSLVKPHHQRLYQILESDGTQSLRPGVRRGIHLCGNATHLFPALSQELGITYFDTGFPVDHGDLRRRLGLDVDIQGGPPIQVLLDGSPREVFDRTRDILLSGVKTGRRFTLSEANNLPPGVPEQNLAAMYAAGLAFGGHEG